MVSVIFLRHIYIYIYISPLQSVTHLPHHHSSCTSVPQGSVLGLILFVLYTTPPSDIANRSVNHQLFVDDTQLQKSAPLPRKHRWPKISSNLMTTKRALLFPFSSSSRPSIISFPDLITLGSHNIPFSDSTRNLGVKNLSNCLFWA